MLAGFLEFEIAKLSEKAARNPGSRIFAPLADAYRKAGRLAEAVELCRRGLRQHPDFVSGSLVLGRCYYEQSDLELARAAFQDVLAAEPRNAVALRALGEIAQARDDLAEAVSWYERALEADPASSEVNERLEALRARRERAAAAAVRPEEAAAEPVAAGGAARGAEWEERSAAGVVEEEEIATVTLAEIYVQQGLHERALAIYRRLLADDPGNPLLREKAEWLEGTIQEERVRLEAEAGSALAGFVPGRLGLGLEEVSIGEAPEAEGAAPWAFLLEDEADRDPDEVFAGRSEGDASVAVGGRPSDEGSQPAGTEPVRETAPEASSLPEEDDLKKFQEWLRSLK